MGVLEKEGLDDVSREVKALAPKIDKAWKARDKTAAMSPEDKKNWNVVKRVTRAEGEPSPPFSDISAIRISRSRKKGSARWSAGAPLNWLPFTVHDDQFRIPTEEFYAWMKSKGAGVR